MHYEESNELALATTLARYGMPVYGKDNLVWYFEVSGVFHRARGYKNVVADPFVMRLYTGDCNLGQADFQIKFSDGNWRQMRTDEINSAVLRSSIDHSEIEYIKGRNTHEHTYQQAS